MYADFHTSRVRESLVKEGYEQIKWDGNFFHTVKENTSYLFSIVRKNYTNDSESQMTVIKDSHLNRLNEVASDNDKVPACALSLWMRNQEIAHVVTIPLNHIGDDLKKVKHGYSIHFRDIKDGSKFRYTTCHQFSTDLIQSFHSWELNPDDTAIKRTDKSVFLHHGTAIPKDVCGFFDTTKMSEGDKQPVTLIHNSGSYSADFTCTNGRVRLLWKHELSELIQTSFPDVYSLYREGKEPESTPRIQFQRSPSDDPIYLVEFLEPDKEHTTKKRRNPKWTRDELILALDLYFREPAAHGNASHPAVIELSDILNDLPLHKGRKLNEMYRNPNGVGMKLANFRAFDPEYDKGLSSSSRLDREVWDTFSLDRNRLHTIAEAIKANYRDVSSADELDDDDEAEAVEGRILTRIHQKRERSAKLIQKKKQQVLKKTGKLECEVCGFDFEEFYGKHGKEFIECHHKKPVSEIKAGEVTKISDLAVICANCHRMIHRIRPWLSLEALKYVILNENPAT